MIFLLCLAAFFVPLGANSMLSIDVGLFQLSPYRFCILIAILMHLLRRGHSIMLLRYEKNNSGYALAFMTVWIFYAVVTVIWALDFTSWLKSIFFMVIGISSIVLFSSYLTNIESIKKVATAYVLGIFIQCIIGWYEIITKNYLFIEMTEKNARNYLTGLYSIPIAMQNNPNNFATLMFVGTVVAMFVYFNEQNRRKKIFFFILAVNSVLLLFLTTSRANMIALLIAAGVFLLFGRKKKPALLVACLAVLLCMPQTTEYINKILQFSFADAGGSDSVRLNLIKTGLAYVLKTFGFGVGAGQVEYWIEHVGTPYYTAGITNIHNWWIELLTNYGIGIFIGYLIFYIRMMHLYRIRSKYDSDKNISISCSLLVAALCGFIIACISPSSMMGLEWSWIFYAFLITYLSFVEHADTLTKD